MVSFVAKGLMTAFVADGRGVCRWFWSVCMEVWGKKRVGFGGEGSCVRGRGFVECVGGMRVGEGLFFLSF